MILPEGKSYDPGAAGNYKIKKPDRRFMRLSGDVLIRENI
jgi:hypothetical protein